MTNRRDVLVSLVGAGCLVGLGMTSASAQAYPTEDIQLVVGYAAGGGADINTRYIASKLKEKAGRQVLVINKPGAAGNIAAGEVARAKPDGHTLFMSGAGITGMNRYLFKSLPYNPETDFTTLATVLLSGFVLVVDPSSPVKTLDELIPYLRKKGKSFYGSSSPSTLAIGETFKSLAKIDTTRVDYRAAAESLNDLKGGHIDFIVMDSPLAAGQARAGKLRLLAVTSGKRMAWAPELPSVSEAGMPDFDLTGWMGLYGPAHMPKPIVEKINGWMREIVSTEETKKFLLNIGCDPLALGVGELDKFHEQATERWVRAIKDANIQPQ